MKQLIIFLLLIIAGIIGYGQYQNHQRFSFKNYSYSPNEDIDVYYHDKGLIYKYHESIEKLNNYIITQWSVNRIDVRNPKKDNPETQTAMDTYAQKLAKIKFFENILIESKKLKDKGLTNDDIKQFENTNMTLSAYQKHKQDNTYRAKMLDNFPETVIRRGKKSAYIYEIQKLLKIKGYDLPIDGVFHTKTFNAIKDFEEKNNLYIDGVLDKITLEALLK